MITLCDHNIKFFIWNLLKSIYPDDSSKCFIYFIANKDIPWSSDILMLSEALLLKECEGRSLQCEQQDMGVTLLIITTPEHDSVTTVIQWGILSKTRNKELVLTMHGCYRKESNGWNTEKMI